MASDISFSPSRLQGRDLAAQRRRMLCEEAARIMLEHGLRDFQTAKQKACIRLAVPCNQAWLPSNKEIEQALKLRQKLFQGERTARRSVSMLELALDLMQRLARFRPKLAGALLRGQMTDRTPVEIHLFTDEVESVARALAEQSIPYDCFDKRFRMRAKDYVQVPGFRFFADDMPVELFTFHLNGERQAPLCPVAGRPMARVGPRRVRELLENGLDN